MAPCTSCSFEKLIARPSPLKVEKESLVFLERIQGDICGPIHPPCGPFRYFMVLIDASSKWSHVSPLSTRNVAFAKFLAQIIKLRAHFPDYTLKRVRLDNAGEFTSQAFNDYCMSVGIVVEHPVAHVHTQNGLAQSLIKRLQLIARLLIMKTKLPVFVWGHAILHAASLIRMRPSANYVYSPMQLAFGQEPSIPHLRILACFADCHFNEAIFPRLGGEKKNHEKDVSWSELSLLYLDPHTNQTRVEIPDVKSDDKFSQESKARLKHGRPVGFKDKNPRKRKAIKNEIIHKDIVLEGIQNVAPPEEEIDDINKEVSINYAMQAELNSLNKRKVFGRIVLTPGVVKPIGYKRVFIQKRNENDEVIRYKARLVAQGFSQRPGIGIDYEETYSPVMDAITFHYLISLAVKENLDMRLMDVVIVYLSLHVDNDPFRPCEEDEDVFGPEVPYLSAIGALVYLTNCTRPDISFAVNLLARFSSSPIKRHWNGIKHTFRYLRGTTDLGLFYSNNLKQGLTLVATSSNHVEVIALHEASRECVWLRSMTQLIVTSCGLNKEKILTIIHEDNAACVALMEEGYIKSDKTKHIPPRYFAYTQDL
nr:retrovirus-related Pol polyprotein from transposon TNT 1-94 [Tanacetum cinerariifolium]